MLSGLTVGRVADSAQRTVEGTSRVAVSAYPDLNDVCVQVSIELACWDNRRADASLRRCTCCRRCWRAGNLSSEQTHQGLIAFRRRGTKRFVLLSACVRLGTGLPIHRTLSLRGALVKWLDAAELAVRNAPEAGGGRNMKGIGLSRFNTEQVVQVAL